MASIKARNEQPIQTILFPSSYFDEKKVDEDLQNEYDAVVETGLFDVILFGYDKWFREQKLVLSKEPETAITVLYRGWMMKPELYHRFYEELQQRGIQLLTSPEAYNRFHIFPNVYEEFGTDTPKMKVVYDTESDYLREIRDSFERFMVKDFVKSVKGTEFPKYFTKDVTDEEFFRWMQVFYKYRGDLLTGGLCFKEYVDLKTYDGKTNEYRVFYVDHEIATVSRNSAQPSYAPEPPNELIEKYQKLESPYYTIDYAELADGRWMILEAGDGSVSGLSEGQDAAAYYRALACLLTCES